MKKLLAGLFLFGLCTIGLQIFANTEDGCKDGEVYSSTTGQICPNTGCSNNEVYSSTTGQKCSTFNIPVISGVSGPQELKVGQTGTWTVKASDLNNDNLWYSVNWGDSMYCPSGGGACSEMTSVLAPQQSAIFTHVYTKIGEYTPTFTVTNSNGKSSKISLSIKVGQSTIICPVDCTCNGDTVQCKAVDNGCLPGFNYSSTTGQKCPQNNDDGCKSGYKYSPVTGVKCIQDETIVGIKDSNGCIPSAGYSWCAVKNKCLRSWEEKCDTASTTSATLITESTSITRILKKGVQGEDVKILQEFLGLTVDGSFGPQTQAKVIEWQESNGLKVDGIFGTQSATKAGLNN